MYGIMSVLNFFFILIIKIFCHCCILIWLNLMLFLGFRIISIIQLNKIQTYGMMISFKIFLKLIMYYFFGIAVWLNCWWISGFGIISIIQLNKIHIRIKVANMNIIIHISFYHGMHFFLKKLICMTIALKYF